MGPTSGFNVGVWSRDWKIAPQVAQVRKMLTCDVVREKGVGPATAGPVSYGEEHGLVLSVKVGSYGRNLNRCWLLQALW